MSLVLAVTFMSSMAGLASAQSPGPSAHPGDGTSPDASAPINSGGLSLVGLGDSLPGALGCAGSCRSYVQVYGDLAAEALGVQVTTTNLATNDGLESSVLLDRVLTDAGHRDAVAGADIVTVQIGLNDWQGICMWDGMAECLAADAAVAEANLAAILDEVVALRDGLPTAIRVVTYFDPYVGTAQAPEWWDFDPSERDHFEATFSAALTDFNSRLCGVAEDHDAICVDTRTPFNGPGWDIEAVPEPADGALVLGGEDHLHMTAAGHELVAEAIAGAGFAPLADGSSAAVAVATGPKPLCANRPAPAWVTDASHANDGIPDPSGRIVFGRITRVDEFHDQIVSLFAIDPDGSDLVQLLDCDAERPRFSPDGSRLAFGIAMDDGSMQVATMAADGSDLRILTTTAGHAGTPDWSSDGSWLVYSLSSPVICESSSRDVCIGDKDIHLATWRMEADGSDQAPLGEQDTFDWEPRLSPDDREVVFNRIDVSNDWWFTLMVRDLASGEERVVTSNEREPEHPDWSPDGRWIIYNTVHPAGSTAISQEQLERVPAGDATAEPEVLHRSPAFKAAYSPDGSSIVFGCGGPLCTMDADGSNVKTLVTTANMDVLPTVPYAELNHFDWGLGGPPAE